MVAEPTSDLKFEIGHVLLIDIVGYSKLLINEQRERLQELNEIVRNTAQFRAAEKNRMLLRIPTGDGMALVFRDSSETPVRCAQEICEALKNHPELQVRMGIHSGPISEVTDVNERANIAGAGINVAQRVMDCGDAGHILLSKRVADDLAQYRHWQGHLHELGECEVKHGVKLGVVNLYTDDLGNPAVPEKISRQQEWTADTQRKARRLTSSPVVAVALFALIALGLMIFRLVGTDRRAVRTKSGVEDGRRSGASLPAEKSIAVLPFENLSEDKANAYFADGMQDEIITRLANIGELRVISRSSTQRYKTKPEDLGEIARQLGVAHFVEGSVQKVEDRVRINVQLIRADTNDHLWAQIYDRKLTDIFAVESEVATAIANSLQAKLTGREEQAVTQKPTDNLDAYDAYLRGLDFMTRPGMSLQNLTAAADLFSEAVRLDPNFALAWGKLCEVNASLYFNQLDATPARRENARVAAETAAALKPDAPETVLANAYYRYHALRDYEGARVLFEKIRQEMPSNSDAIDALAFIARRQSRWTDALKLFDEAVRLNPRDADLLIEWSWTLSMIRQISAAIQIADRALNILPNDPGLLANKAYLHQTEGNLPAAASVLAKLGPESSDESAIPTWINQFLFERRYGDAIGFLQKTLTAAGSKPTIIGNLFRLSLALAQDLAGEEGAARATYLQARDELETLQREQPANFNIVAGLAAAHAGLGNKEAALREGERSLAMLPATEDPVVGPVMEELFARTEAQIGEVDRAIARLERLLVTPYGAYPITQAILRLDPAFDPLRTHPRFQKLVSGPEPKTVYQ